MATRFTFTKDNDDDFDLFGALKPQKCGTDTGDNVGAPRRAHTHRKLCSMPDPARACDSGRGLAYMRARNLLPSGDRT
jgi:hypothetical protein